MRLYVKVLETGVVRPRMLAHFKNALVTRDSDWESLHAFVEAGRKIGFITEVNVHHGDFGKGFTGTTMQHLPEFRKEAYGWGPDRGPAVGTDTYVLQNDAGKVLGTYSSVKAAHLQCIRRGEHELFQLSDYVWHAGTYVIMKCKLDF